MTRVALVLTMALLVFPERGQAQSGQTGCPDRLREVTVLADQLARSRTRQEVDAARAIADLLKQVEALRVENERLRVIPKPKE